jgi:hypothetical protein
MKLDHSPRSSARRLGSLGRAALAGAVCAAGLVAAPTRAHAQEVVVVEPRGEVRSTYYGPNWGLLTSGLILFGGTYTASFVVAATSGHAGDQALYAPVVGPWLDIANRCPNGCNDDAGRKVLLGFDGVVQGIGVLAVITSFFVPNGHERGVARIGRTATLRILPGSFGGAGSPGLRAVGTF